MFHLFRISFIMFAKLLEKQRHLFSTHYLFLRSLYMVLFNQVMFLQRHEGGFFNRNFCNSTIICTADFAFLFRRWLSSLSHLLFSFPPWSSQNCADDSQSMWLILATWFTFSWYLLICHLVFSRKYDSIFCVNIVTLKYVSVLCL